FDWMSSTIYAGSFKGSLDNVGLGIAQWTPTKPSNAHHSISIAELSRPDSILLYARDELHDNGMSHLLVRV
ncbi:hypothetical protein EDB83DRAFT_2201287, partial [Lactarius deliciosus]